MEKINIVNVSGGVDSTACYLLALERGEPFRAVFADTGNEHKITLDYVRELGKKTGGPDVQIVRADLRAKINLRRYNLEMMIETGNYKNGWDEASARRVVENLQATGVPFLDICILHGMFPIIPKRFCTGEAKLDAIKKQVVYPAIEEAVAQGGSARDVVEWVGVRRDESKARADALEWETDGQTGCTIYRPLVEWNKAQCFDLLHRHGVEPNPLYKMGCRRVGCMPCIMSGKADILNIAQRWPEHIDKVREWEKLVSQCCKIEAGATFFGHTVGNEATKGGGIDNVVEWAKTGRGGIQYRMDAMLEPPACSSLYGLCE